MPQIAACIGVWIVFGWINVFLTRKIANRAGDRLRDHWFFAFHIFILGPLGTLVILIVSRITTGRWKV